MAISDEDVGLEIPDQQETPEPTETPEPQPEKTPEQKELEDLRGTVSDLKGKAAILDQLGPLLPSVKAALDKFVTPEVGETRPDPEQLKALGERIQKTMLTGSPEEAATLFIQGIREISKQNVDTEIARVGGPMVDKVGDFVLSSYLSMRQQEDPAKAKMHALVAKEMTLTSQEKAYLGAAPAAEVRTFLDRRYKETAGELALRAPVRTRDISGGAGGGGASAAGAAAAPPGFPAEAWAQQVRLNEILYPDEKIRAQKLKELRASLMAETA